MGSWGVGMQANDTALDYIGDAYGKKKPSLKSLKELVKSIKSLIVDRENHVYDQGILGMADFILDHNPKLLTDLNLIKQIDESVDNELKRLDNWIDGGNKSASEGRKGALLRFRDRLHGKKVDEDDLIVDNLGLFDQICVKGKSRDEVKAMLKPKATPATILEHMHHAYAQTDGTYAWPNSREGDMLRGCYEIFMSMKKP